jgi:Cu/Ag efflux protein CusF
VKPALFAFALIALNLPGAALAQATDPVAQIPVESKPPATASTLADGEVRRVDKEASKITLRHGPIPSLDMPAMSMVFQVKDAALLDQIKPGDKIRFNAEKASGQYVITHIELAK